MDVLSADLAGLVDRFLLHRPSIGICVWKPCCSRCVVGMMLVCLSAIVVFWGSSTVRPFGGGGEMTQRAKLADFAKSDRKASMFPITFTSTCSILGISNV